MTFEDAVKEVFYWQYGNTNCFNQKILTAYQTADRSNKIKLHAIFPVLIRAFLAWEESGDYGNDLFREHGLIGENEIPMRDDRSPPLTKRIIKDRIKMALMVGPLNELEKRLDEALDEVL